MRGISIILVEQTEIGRNPFGEAIYEDVEVVVDDVLVGLPESTDVINAQSMYGKKLSYVLGIPKGDTHNWQDTQVKFFGRTFNTFGYPIEGIEALVPTKWHKKVMVELYG